MTKKRLLISLLCCVTILLCTHAQAYSMYASEELVQLTFREGNDTLFVEGNMSELEKLYQLVDKYRNEIMAGLIPLYVCGFSASLCSDRENLNMASVRANRVKSELITNKRLRETHFVTTNYATSFNVMPDVVVVMMRIPDRDSVPDGISFFTKISREEII